MAVRTVYRGALGTTRKEQIHLTCPCGAILSAEAHRSIDVSAHPDLAARLGGRDRAQPIDQATCPECGETTAVNTRFLYHDPGRYLFVLVLPKNERHTELSARAELFLALDADPAPVPAYVRDFDVVFGVDGLRSFLHERSERRARAERDAEAAARMEQQAARLEIERAEMNKREAALEETRQAFARRELTLNEERDALARERDAFEKRSRELADGERALEEKTQQLAVRERALEVAATRDAHPTQEMGRDTEQVRIIDHPSTHPSGHAPVENTENVGHDAQTGTASPSVSAAPGDKTMLVSNPLIAHPTATPATTSSAVSPIVSSAASPAASPALSNVHADADPHHETTSQAERPPGLFEPDDADLDGPVMPDENSGEVSQVTELDPNDAIELSEDEVVVTDVAVNPSEPRHAALEPWLQSGEPAVIFADTQTRTPHLAIMVDARQAQALASRLEVRIQLHAMPTFPLVVLAIGARGSFSYESSAPAPISVPMNVDDPKHHSVLTMLSRSFTLHVDVFDTSYTLMRRMLVTAGLEENVRYVGERARDHLDELEERDRSLGQAVAQWAHRDYDRFGWQHRERGEFREEKLTDLSSAQTVRRALAMADRFSKPERQDYLFGIRGYPIALWTRQRRAVMERALELGIWMGKRLGPIAVEEGLAPSYEALIERTRENFQRIEETRPPDFDLDPDAASDNRMALDAEMEELRKNPMVVGDDTRAMGRRKRPRATPIASSAAQQVSGTIRETSRVIKQAGSTRNMSVDELMQRLSDKDRRVSAAIELARRREPRAVEPIMQAVGDMNRKDAVRVLGAMPSFADVATHALVQGLASHKGFIRQGCALALAIIQNETALEALSDQVISEPTVIWREMARGLGTVGPSAIMPLVSRLSRNDHGAHERVAWALAHIAARGGKRQVGQLAKGRDPLAAGVAKNALELASHAKQDDLQVRGANTPKEQTVNRAFSRSFFQALEASSPVIDPMATADMTADMSSPAMLLDEADLLEAAEYDATDDAEEMLDESDLIPT